MHSEIQLIQGKVLELFQLQRGYLRSKPTEYLEELLHRSVDEIAAGETFSSRTAAQINHAACSLILEERRATSTNSPAVPAASFSPLTKSTTHTT